VVAMAAPRPINPHADALAAETEVRRESSTPRKPDREEGPDHRHRRLLRARRQRPCGGRTAEQRDEFASPIKKMTGHDTTARSSTPSTPNLSRLSSSRVGQKAGA
jgi:hypothetical protein